MTFKNGTVFTCLGQDKFPLQSKIAIAYTFTFIMAILIEDFSVRTFKQLHDKALRL